MTDERFFPVGTFGDETRTIPGLWPAGERYSQILESMGECPLRLGLPNTALVLRLLALPAFDNPRVVRVWQSQSESRWRVVSKRGNWRGGYAAGFEREERERELNGDEGARIVEELTRLGIWSLPTNDNHRGVDGWDCLLETAGHNHYHVVHRWSPAPGPFVEFCQLLVRAAQVEHDAA
jgi:hypothetical protein